MSELLSKILNRGFRRYVRRFVRKNFSAVRVAGWQQFTKLPEGPVVCFANHPGWWDPMTAVLMTDLLFPGRNFVAPMDAKALQSYPILERLGFFPVERDTTQGAKEFLMNCRRILKNPMTILWLTPAGKFHDVRQPQPFQNGLGHLVNSEFRGTAMPMAIEYTFWSERSPELLVRFGPPIDCAALPTDRAARTGHLESALATTQLLLAEAAMARDPAGFTTFALGRADIGGLYDFWRRLTAGLQKRKYQERHAIEQTPASSSVQGEMV